MSTSSPESPVRAVPRGVVFLNWRDTTHPEGGGSELFVEQVAAGLAAQGRPVTLFCAAHPGAAREELRGGVRILRRGGRLTVYLHALRLHLSGRLGPHGVVVDVQNGVPFWSALWCRKPVVVLVHHVHREQWGVVLPGWMARVGWWLESAVAPRVCRRARYVTVSEATRRELIGLGVRAGAISVVRNGTPAPPPGPAPARAAEPTVCVLGRLVPHKRVELALEAVARIRGRVPGLRLEVLGQGYWEPELRAAAARLGLDGAVEFRGFVDEASKHRLLASSWVLALPSLKEGWAVAVVEAAAHGTPAVAFRAAGGVAESVVDGRTGLLADDAEEFAAQLERVLRDEALRERLGLAARAHAKRFTWPRAVAAFGEALEAAAGAGQAGEAQTAAGSPA